MRNLLSMTVSLPALALSLLASAPAAAVPAPARPSRPAPTMVLVDQRDLLDELRALQSQVQELQSQANKGREKKELRRGLDSVSTRLARLERTIRQSRPAAPDRRPPLVVVGPTAMAPASFAALHKSVSTASFDNDRLVVVRTALRDNWVAVDQARTLMAEFRMSSVKVEALRLLWPRVVDRENGFRFYEDFPFPSDRSAARAIIES